MSHDFTLVMNFPMWYKSVTGIVVSVLILWIRFFVVWIQTVCLLVLTLDDFSFVR